MPQFGRTDDTPVSNRGNPVSFRGAQTSEAGSDFYGNDRADVPGSFAQAILFGTTSAQLPVLESNGTSQNRNHPIINKPPVPHVNAQDVCTPTTRLAAESEAFSSSAA